MADADKHTTKIPRKAPTAALAFLGMLTIGCGAGPRAPALIQNETVYHDVSEGFQFVPPSGWSQHARAQYPRGRQQQERMLVKYKRLDDGGPAFFRASMVDLPESVAATSYLRERPPGPENWQSTPGFETVTVHGITAERVTFTGVWEEGNKQAVVKEVVAVRHNGRIYFFSGIFGAADNTAQAQIRQCVASIAWDKESGARH
jgi:hypothetical protein